MFGSIFLECATDIAIIILNISAMCSGQVIIVVSRMVFWHFYGVRLTALEGLFRSDKIPGGWLIWLYLFIFNWVFILPVTAP